MMRDACLVVMVRCPEKGKVKTRLAADVGDILAAELYRCFVEDLLPKMREVPADILIGFHPPSKRRCIEDWLGKGPGLIPQRGRDIGERQASLFETAFAMGYDRVIVMASDAPDLPIGIVVKAFDELKVSDSVMGPCQDGGYNLIGFDTGGYNGDLFRDVPWGGPGAAKKMLERMERSGSRTASVETWWDVDDIDDLQALYRRSVKNGYSDRTISCIEREGLFDEG